MNRNFCLLAMMAAFVSPALASPGRAKPPRPSSLLRHIRLDYIEAYIEEAAVKERLEPALLRALVRVESNFNHKATSKVGAKGLMQIMPLTASDLGNRKALDQHNPRANILAGSHYLRGLINQFGGDVPLALAAYNAGPAAVTKYKGIPPYAETRAYVSKVMGQLEDERTYVAEKTN